MQLDERFTSDCQEASAILKRVYKYNAARFNQMLADVGGVETARRLIEMRGASDGYRFLWEVQRLDLSAEALALLPEYRSLFKEHELRSAQQTLEASPFPVEAFSQARGTRAAPMEAITETRLMQAAGRVPGHLST